MDDIRPRYVVSFDLGCALEQLPDDERRVIVRRLAILEQELTVALMTGQDTPNVRQVHPDRPGARLGVVRTHIA